MRAATDQAAHDERVPIAERSLSIDKFCETEGFSRSFYNKLVRMGLGPHVTEIIGPGLSLKRITPESRRAWRQRMEEYRASEEAQLEHERRQQQRVDAGKKSINSDKHVSKKSSKKPSRARAARR